MESTSLEHIFNDGNIKLLGDIETFLVKMPLTAREEQREEAIESDVEGGEERWDDGIRAEENRQALQRNLQTNREGREADEPETQGDDIETDERHTQERGSAVDWGEGDKR